MDQDQDQSDIIREFLIACLLRFGNPIPLQSLIDSRWYQDTRFSMHPSHVRPPGAAAWVDEEETVIEFTQAGLGFIKGE